MTEHAPQAPIDAAARAHHDRLRGMALRMLGSRADAEDVMREAGRRLAYRDPDSPDSTDSAGDRPTIEVGRLCLDLLRSGRAPRDRPRDDRTPPVDDAPGNAAGAVPLAALDRLRPDERVAFVLHDAYAVPYDEIAPVLARSAAATKAITARARARVWFATRPRETPDTP